MRCQSKYYYMHNKKGEKNSEVLSIIREEKPFLSHFSQPLLMVFFFQQWNIHKLLHCFFFYWMGNPCEPAACMNCCAAAVDAAAAAAKFWPP